MSSDEPIDRPSAETPSSTDDAGSGRPPFADEPDDPAKPRLGRKSRIPRRSRPASSTRQQRRAHSNGEKRGGKTALYVSIASAVFAGLSASGGIISAITAKNAYEQNRAQIIRAQKMESEAQALNVNINVLGQTKLHPQIVISNGSKLAIRRIQIVGLSSDRSIQTVYFSDPYIDPCKRVLINIPGELASEFPPPMPLAVVFKDTAKNYWLRTRALGLRKIDTADVEAAPSDPQEWNITKRFIPSCLR